MLERLQVVEGDGRVGLDLLHEGSDVGLIFKGELQLCRTDDVGVERELELNVLHVVFVLIVHHSNVLRILPVLDDHASAVGSSANTLLLQLPLDLSEPLSSSIPGDQHVGRLEPDADQATTHSEVVVLKGVPLWWIGELHMSVYNDSVLIVDVAESLNITISHELLHLSHKLSSLVLDRIDSTLCDRGISNALEEFDALFSLKVFEMAILLDEVLLHHSHFTLHVVIWSFG